MSMYLIATNILTSATIFTNIPQNFSHLQLRITGRSTSSASYATIYTGFNSDLFSNPNYSNHSFSGDGATMAVNGQASVNQFNLTGFVWASVTANVQGSVILDVLDYANTNKNKTSRYICGWDANGSGKLTVGSSLWMNTAAVTSLTVLPDGGWATGARADLYGVISSSATGA